MEGALTWRVMLLLREPVDEKKEGKSSVIVANS